jgi:hypothetical protein
MPVVRRAAPLAGQFRWPDSPPPLLNREDNGRRARQVTKQVSSVSSGCRRGPAATHKASRPGFIDDAGMHPDFFAQPRFVITRKLCYALKHRTIQFLVNPDPLGIGSYDLRYAWLRLVYSIYTVDNPIEELSIRSSYVIGSYERIAAFHSDFLTDRIQTTILP